MDVENVLVVKEEVVKVEKDDVGLLRLWEFRRFWMRG